jgi:hypothetical protein
MTLPPPEICQRIRNLHAMMGSPNDNEANVARERLNKLLAKEGVTWNDLPEILAGRYQYHREYQHRAIRAANGRARG